jgi:hypothetical protein
MKAFPVCLVLCHTTIEGVEVDDRSASKVRRPQFNRAGIVPALGLQSNPGPMPRILQALLLQLRSRNLLL